MKKNIAKLIDLKTIITISITGALIFGFCVDKITPEQFMTIATMIFTFYFAKKDKGDDTMSKSGLEEITITGETTGTEEAPEKAEV